MKCTSVFAVFLSFVAATTSPGLAQAWTVHPIGPASGGADGPRLCDVNGDGLPDFSCGWEGAKMARIHINPGPDRVRSEWPSVDLRLSGYPEDALCVDLDGDGALDVVACLDGGNAVEVHFAPPNKSDYMNGSKWTGGKVPCSQIGQPWMFAAAMDVDGKNGIDFVAGGKVNAVGWFEAPADPRNIADWKFHKIADPQGSWTMDIHLHDIDGDGDLDVFNSRKLGDRTGAYFYLNPGRNSSSLTGAWKEIVLTSSLECGFGDIADLDGDGIKEICVGKQRQAMGLIFTPTVSDGNVTFTMTTASGPGTGTHATKGLCCADLNGDRKIDLVCAATPSVWWMEYDRQYTESDWTVHQIMDGGGKLDNTVTADVDADGDLDVLTTDERGKQLLWLENPSNPPVTTISIHIGEHRSPAAAGKTGMPVVTGHVFDLAGRIAGTVPLSRRSASTAILTVSPLRTAAGLHVYDGRR